MKVLLTDDSEFMRAIIRKTLSQFEGLEFFEAENGDVAVELYREHSPDIVFLDIIMPVKNGIMALQEIRQLNPDAKVVIVTSVGQEEMTQKAEELKADGFVPKPFKADQIATVFKEVTGGGGSSETAAPSTQSEESSSSPTPEVVATPEPTPTEPETSSATTPEPSAPASPEPTPAPAVVEQSAAPTPTEPASATPEQPAEPAAPSPEVKPQTEVSAAPTPDPTINS